MSTAMIVPKSTGLVKTGSTVRNLASRLEQARQTRNERVSRADAEYVEAVRRALAEIEPAAEAALEHTPEPVTVPDATAS
jgi:hypothetical protein